MNITRPHDAEDNEYNIEMNKVLDHWADRHGEIIVSKEIYKYAVVAKTETGREIIATKADGCRSRHINVRNFIYMKEIKDGKHIRIKKEDW